MTQHSPELLAAIAQDTADLVAKLSEPCVGVNIAIVLGALVEMSGGVLELIKREGPPGMYDSAARQFSELPGKVSAVVNNKINRH